jgi:hypothetical protein
MIRAKMKRTFNLVNLVLVTAGALATFGLGRSFHRRPPDVHATERARPGDPQAALAEQSVAGPALNRRPRVLPPTFASVAPEAPRSPRAGEARQTIGALFSRVNDRAIPGAVPEFNANSQHAFMLGWLDGLHYTSPALRKDLALELRDRICASALNEMDGILLGQLLQRAPELASPEAFECFFSQAADTTARAKMIDAWRNSGLEPTPSLERLAETNPDILHETPSLISSDDH